MRDFLLPTLTTARLVLRPLQLDDAPHVQRLFPQWNVVRFMNPAIPWPYPADGAETYLRSVLADPRQLMWAILLRGELIGAIGFSPHGHENRGFWLAPDHWGQGYMGEAVDRTTDYVMGELGWPEIRTGNAVENSASSRLKRGFRLLSTGPRQLVGGVMEYESWLLTQEDYQRHKAQPTQAPL